MKIIAKTLLASSLCMFMAVPAHAGRYHDDGRMVDRVERQHERIVSGLESGSLTHKEPVVWPGYLMKMVCSQKKNVSS